MNASTRIGRRAQRRRGSYRSWTRTSGSRSNSLGTSRRRSTCGSMTSCATAAATCCPSAHTSRRCHLAFDQDAKAGDRLVVHCHAGILAFDGIVRGAARATGSRRRRRCVRRAARDPCSFMAELSDRCVRGPHARDARDIDGSASRPPPADEGGLPRPPYAGEARSVRTLRSVGML